MKNSLKILLIEDNPGDVLLIREILKETKRAEFEITNATRLNESLEFMNRGNYNVILLDFGLPDSQGIDTLKKVNSHAPELPIVILTGLDDEAVALQAIHEGAQDYITKNDLTGELLARLLRYAIERKKTEKELLQHRNELEKLVTIRTKQLAENEEKFRAFFEQAAVGVVIVDTKTGLYVRVNDKFCDIVGYTRDEMLKSDFTKITHPDDLKKDIENIEMLKTEKIREFSTEKRYYKKNGTMIWVNMTASALSKNSSTDYVIGIIKDITKNKLAEEMLKKALAKEKEINEMKSKFVSMVSHEFRTPLAAITFASGFVKKYWKKISESDRNKKLQKIEKQVNNMTSLLNDVLTYGKTESGKIVPNPKEFTFKEFFIPIFDEIYSAIDKSHQINMTVNTDDYKLFIDEKLGRNIFINLITNAIKFSPDKTFVKFMIERDKENCIFKIKDYGIGINEKELQAIFIPFYRGLNVEIIKGTGLGLSIVKESVEKLGGEITVESKIGEGTCFTVKLPLNPKEYQPA